MSESLNHIRALVAQGKYELTAHAFAELHKDNMVFGDVVAGLPAAVVVEDYPDYHKGPSVLVLLRDSNGEPVHALWGVPKGSGEPAYLVTAYRPDSDRWTPDFLTRRAK